MAGDFKETSPTQLLLDASLVIPNAELVNVHPLIKCLFSKEILTKVADIPPIVTGKVLHDETHLDAVRGLM